MQKRPSEYSLEFLPEVGRDVQEAYDWYELQSIGLGENFLLSLDAALDVIRRNPLIYSKAHKAVRKANVKRFPFGVFLCLEQRDHNGSRYCTPLTPPKHLEEKKED